MNKTIQDPFSQAEKSINEYKITDELKKYVQTCQKKNSYGVSLRIWAMYNGIIEWLDLITEGEAPLALIFAIRGGNKDIAKKILDKFSTKSDELFNAIDNIDFTALHYAIAQEFNDIAKEIINKYPNSIINVSPNNNVTPLHIAVKYGNFDIIDFLISKNKDQIRKRDYNLQFPYENAFECVKKFDSTSKNYFNYLKVLNEIAVPTQSMLPKMHDMESEVIKEEGIMKKLNSQPMLPLYRDIHCRTILHYAVMAGNQKVVEQIISKCPFVDVTDDGGVTPLMIAMNYPDIAEILIKNGADKNRISKKGICFSFPIIPDYLVDPSPSDFRGNVLSINPILLETTRVCKLPAVAKSSNQIRNVTRNSSIPLSTMQSRLVSNCFFTCLSEKYFELINPDLRDPNDHNNLPIHKVAGYALIQPFKKLLSRTKSVDVTNDLNETPLMIAARNGTIDIVRELLARGADLKPGGPNTQIFYQIALCYDDTLAMEIFDLVLEKFGKKKFKEILEKNPIQLCGPDRNTPLHIALRLGNKIAEQFLDHFKSVLLFKNSIGEVPLIVAFDAGASPELILRIIRMEPLAVKLITNDSSTMLHKAAGLNSVEVLTTVIDILKEHQKFKPMAMNNARQMAIDVAIEKRVTGNFAILLQYLEMKDPPEGGRPNMSPLMYAVSVGDPKLVQLAIPRTSFVERFKFRWGEMTAIELAGYLYGKDRKWKNIYDMMMKAADTLKINKSEIDQLKKSAQSWFNKVYKK